MSVKRRIGGMLSAAMLGIAVTLCFARGVMAQDAYVITGSGALFTAAKGGATVGTANQPIQTIIDAVKTNAAGNPCTIQFGNGTATLEVVGKIVFDGGAGGNDWGLVTLAGKISSSWSSETLPSGIGAISLRNGVSVNSAADITNTNPPAIWSFAIANESAGSVTVSGGTVSSSGHNNGGIMNTSAGSVIISGGTVSSSGNYTIYNSITAGSVTISGGALSPTGLAIYNQSASSITISGGAVGTIVNNANGSVNISGGTVSNISNQSAGSVTVSGGKILARNGYAILNGNTGAVTLTGDGVVFAYGTGADNVIRGAYTQDGNSVIIAWDQAAGNSEYTKSSGTDLFVAVSPPPTASTPVMTAVWDVPNRIAYSHVSNTGFIEIEGVTVTNVSTSVHPPARANIANPAQFVQVSGHTLQLRLLDRGKVAVYSLNGAKVRAFDLGQGAHALRMDDLPRGTYMVRASSGAWKQSVRMAVR